LKQLLEEVNDENEYKAVPFYRKAIAHALVPRHKAMNAVWEEFAENVVESLRKGMQVIVVGRQFMDTYTTKDGAERQTLKVAAYSIGPDLKRGMFQKVESTGARGSATPRPSDDPWSTPVQDDIPPF
jgi:single-strand DNA-binding protein